MADLRRVRRIIEDVAATIAEDAPFPTSEEVERQAGALAATFPGVVERRAIGRSREGRLVSALAVGAGEAGFGALLVGMPRGDAPVGAVAALALARRLAEDRDLRRELGAAWTLVPCADPDGAALNAGWFARPFALGRYGRNGVVPAPEDRVDWNVGAGMRPETAALTRLIDQTRPRMTLLLYDAPAGGAALFERRATSDERRTGTGTCIGTGNRAADSSSLVAPGTRLRVSSLGKLVDWLGLPLDLGGVWGELEEASGPGVYPLADAGGAAGDPGARLLAGHRGLGLVEYAGRRALEEGGFAGAVIMPRLLDYARREGDRTPVAARLRDVALDGAQLRREWLAFGRATIEGLDLAGLAGGPLHRAVVAGLRGTDGGAEGGVAAPGVVPDAGAVQAAWRRWAGSLPGADRPATIAQAFAHGDWVRVARLPRVGALARLLADAAARAVSGATGLEAALAAATELRDRWIDDLEAADLFRPAPLARLAGAQIGTALALLPTTDAR